MIGAILSIIGVILIVYIFIRTRKMENESKARMRELKIVYSVGLKEFNKSQQPIIH